MLGALSNVQTKVIFGVSRHDAEFFAKVIGRVDTEAIKRDPKTENQHELFASLPEQWEQWIDKLRFQPPRYAMVASRDGKVASIRTVTIPSYSASDEEVEAIRQESLKRYGIPYNEAVNKMVEHCQTDEEAVSEIPVYGW
jgi:hypothetical protein